MFLSHVLAHLFSPLALVLLRAAGHPRAVHSGGVNVSDRVRIVVPCDFQKDAPVIPFPPYSGHSRRRAAASGKSLDPIDSGKPEELTLQWWIDVSRCICCGRL